MEIKVGKSASRQVGALGCQYWELLGIIMEFYSPNNRRSNLA